jgi:hypothetical protein
MLSDLTPLQKLNALLDILEEHDLVANSIAVTIRETLDELRVGFDDATELRSALGIPEDATHDEAVERARRIAYEAETARLIEQQVCEMTRCGPDEIALWHVDVLRGGTWQHGRDANLHLAVRAAAGKGES